MCSHILFIDHSQKRFWLSGQCVCLASWGCEIDYVTSPERLGRTTAATVVVGFYSHYGLSLYHSKILFDYHERLDYQASLSLLTENNSMDVDPLHTLSRHQVRFDFLEDLCKWDVQLFQSKLIQLFHHIECCKQTSAWLGLLRDTRNALSRIVQWRKCEYTSICNWDIDVTSNHSS